MTLPGDDVKIEAYQADAAARDGAVKWDANAARRQNTKTRRGRKNDERLGWRRMVMVVTYSALDCMMSIYLQQ
jgi:hypothetical protein